MKNITNIENIWWTIETLFKPLAKFIDNKLNTEIGTMHISIQIAANVCYYHLSKTGTEMGSFSFCDGFSRDMYDEYINKGALQHTSANRYAQNLPLTKMMIYKKAYIINSPFYADKSCEFKFTIALKEKNCVVKWCGKTIDIMYENKIDDLFFEEVWEDMLNQNKL